MTVRFRPRGRREVPAPDLTPLIDVVFLLLIFFLVTATFAQQDRSLLPIDLPEGGTGEGSSQQDIITLYLTAEGTVNLASPEGTLAEDLEEADLREALQRLHEANPDQVLYLRGDRDVAYGHVMSLLDLARSIGFRRVFNVLQVPRADER